MKVSYIPWLLCICLFLAVHPTSAEPPHPRKVVKNVHQKIAGFFYKAARTLEGDTGKSSRKPSRSQRASEAERELEIASGIHDPGTPNREFDHYRPSPQHAQHYRAHTQEHRTVVEPQPKIILKNRRSPNASQTITPAPAPMNPPDLATIETQQLSRPEPQITTEQSAMSDAASPAKLSETPYATPVPGKPGFVFAPNTEQIPANMLDVRGLSTGQKARDPRNGSVFLVP